ncbi:MAG: hypothetical protein BWY53_00467 [Parcubacteria group bacterium ADurb.Bin326]|nr:MAG: hypothetical protein BWY53_00467 [Parcubacteria group bacterium ADurb.Bin326]
MPKASDTPINLPEITGKLKPEKEVVAIDMIAEPESKFQVFGLVKVFSLSSTAMELVVNPSNFLLLKALGTAPNLFLGVSVSQEGTPVPPTETSRYIS